MFAKSVRNLIAFIFLFTVLEKTGCDLMFLVKWNPGFETLTEFFESEQEGTKEKEAKEKSIKEFWIGPGFQSLATLHLTDGFKKNLVMDIHSWISFYPSVPTPPPNFLIV